MTNRELIIRELEDLPEIKLAEILDFIRFIKEKSVLDKYDITIISESSLKKDWLKSEEDEAWRDL
ncbi:MAG: hypothetical protein PWR10_2507 [Halanaerobiales bacterium]|nr:hypothetical protein [Halanaerobiales bacterium]